MVDPTVVPKRLYPPLDGPKIGILFGLQVQYDCASSLQSSGAADCASPCDQAGMRNEDPIHDVQNMTSVDEFEPPLPSLAPALAAPDIKPSLKGTSLFCINPLQHPAGDQPGLASCRRCRFPSHAPRFSDHPPVGTGHPVPPLPGSNVPPFLQPGRGWPPCRLAAFVDETNGSAGRVQKSSFREALPRRDSRGAQQAGTTIRLSLWTSWISWTTPTGTQPRKLIIA